MKISEVMRRALTQWHENQAEVSRATGIPQSVLSRFTREESTLRGYHVDTLAEYLGLELKPAKKGGK
jgi:predicted XRE-type DNA-binding protein